MKKKLVFVIPVLLLLATPLVFALECNEKTLCSQTIIENNITKWCRDLGEGYQWYTLEQGKSFCDSPEDIGNKGYCQGYEIICTDETVWRTCSPEQKCNTNFEINGIPHWCRNINDQGWKWHKCAQCNTGNFCEKNNFPSETFITGDYAQCETTYFTCTDENKWLPGLLDLKESSEEENQQTKELQGAQSETCNPPAEGDWIIDSTQNCDNKGLIPIFGNVIVQSSGSLILTGSSINLELPETYILVNGSIIADSAAFSGLPGEADYKETDNQIILNGNIDIQNSDFSYFTSGVILSGSISRFKNNEIFENWERGLVVQADNAVIQGNTVKDIRKTIGGPACAFFCIWAKGQGIIVEGNNNELLNNHVYEMEGGLFKTGIRVKGNDNLIQYNELEHNNFNLGVEGNRNIIDQNTINSGGLVAIGVSKGEGNNITSNTVLKSAGAGIGASDSSNIYIYDNAIANAAVGLAAINIEDSLFKTNYVEDSNVSLVVMQGSTNNVFDDIQNTNIVQGLMIYNASNNKIQNTDLTGSDVDISVDDPSHFIFQLLQQTPEPATSTNDLIDVDFVDYYFGNSNSKTYVNWFTDFNVTDEAGNCLDGAQVEGYQSDGSLEFNETTQSIIYDLPVVDYVINGEGIIQYNAYTINASKEGYAENSATESIDQEGLMVNFVLEEAAPNQPPVAEAGDTVFGDTYQMLLFNFTLSYDPDGEIVEYFVKWGDGSNDTSSNPYMTHTYTTSGPKLVNLTVWDDDGLGDVDYTSAQIAYPTGMSTTLETDIYQDILSPIESPTTDTIKTKKTKIKKNK